MLLHYICHTSKKMNYQQNVLEVPKHEVVTVQ